MKRDEVKHINSSSWVVRATTWFSSLAILNLCWLLFSFPVVTLIPATDAVFEVLNDWENGREGGSVFRMFFFYFKQNFWNSFRWGLPLLIAAVIIGVDVYFLTQQTLAATWFQIFKYAFYTVVLLFVLAVIYGYPLSKQLNNQHIRMVLMGLFSAVGNPLVTAAVIGGLIVLGVIFWFFPAMLFFFSLSGPAWIGTRAVAVIVRKADEN